MRSYESVGFDASDYTLQAESTQLRVWHTPLGDEVALFYFALPPDIPVDLGSLPALRTAYRAVASLAGVGLIAVDTCSIAGCIAVRQIVKVPQQPSGMTYVGLLTLPFRDFSYVLKVLCEEHGVTGVRDAVVCQEVMQAGQVTPDVDAGVLLGWAADPYDPTLREGLLRNLSEAEEYDARFPDHPLSRCRAVLQHLERTLRVADEVRTAPPWRFPPEPPRRRWWRLW